jgi:hypothetical protein
MLSKIAGIITRSVFKAMINCYLVNQGDRHFLTAVGDLFCGNLLVNTEKLVFFSTMDDPATANANIKRLRQFEAGTVYPEHGAIISLAKFNKYYRPSL